MPTVRFEGIIKKINPSEIIKNFEKRSFLLAEEKYKYPSVWMLEFQQGLCNTLDQFKPGDKVSVDVEILGREWNDKAFNTLKAFRMGMVAPAPKPFVEIESNDDLPF